jgi:hypothetical protein
LCQKRRAKTGGLKTALLKTALLKIRRLFQEPGRSMPIVFIHACTLSGQAVTGSSVRRNP